MDPLRLSSTGGNGFPQDWTVYYWAYWIAWFVATPFFIAQISEGRTIRETVLGGLSCGLAGTYTSFVTFQGFGLYQQVTGKADIAGALSEGASIPVSYTHLDVYKRQAVGRQRPAVQVCRRPARPPERAQNRKRRQRAA